MIEAALTGAATPGEDVVTELEVMRSRRLAAKVVDDLDLINDPEFNSHLVEPSTVCKDRRLGEPDAAAGAGDAGAGA